VLVDALDGLHAAHEHCDEDGYPLYLAPGNCVSSTSRTETPGAHGDGKAGRAQKTLVTRVITRRPAGSG